VILSNDLNNLQEILSLKTFSWDRYPVGTAALTPQNKSHNFQCATSLRCPSSNASSGYWQDFFMQTGAKSRNDFLGSKAGSSKRSMAKSKCFSPHKQLGVSLLVLSLVEAGEI
jgi:hypothetical protein